MLTPEQLAEIRERMEKVEKPHTIFLDTDTGKRFIPESNSGVDDIRALLSNIEELTTNFAKEVEENAALKKENARLLGLERRVDSVLVWYRREHASTPLSQRRNETAWIKKLEDVMTL